MKDEIRVGTLVLIVKTSYPEMLGRVAEVIDLDADDDQGYVFVIKTEPTDLSPQGTWRARREQIMPISPPDTGDTTNTDTPVEQRELLPA